MVAVVGCGELAVPSHGYLTRSNSVAVVTCEGTGAVQKILCVDNVWEGKFEECVQGGNYISLNLV